jgi:fructoselysine-6-P-deglycase FrlB-like protein
MRIHEGVFAYELRKLVNLETQLPAGWDYLVYQIKPEEQLLFIGRSRKRGEAEQAALQVIELLKMKQAA